MTDEKKPKQPKSGAGKKSAKKAADTSGSNASEPTLNGASTVAPESRSGDIQADTAAPSAAKNVNPIVLDDTYQELREQNRVVMRRTIAVNLDNFRAAPEDFDPRPRREYPTLLPVDAPFFSVVVPTYNGLRHMAGVLDAQNL